MQKLGTGTLILTGTSINSGTTTITAGKLQIGDGGTTGTIGSGAIINNATLVFARTNALTFNNLVTGTGEVIFNSGTTIMSQFNDYTGGSIINGGTVLFGSGYALGYGNVQVTSGRTLDFNGIQPSDIVVSGDMFARVAQPTTTGIVTNSNAATITLSADIVDNLVFNGRITGNIHFTKFGVGTLYVTGDSTVSAPANGIGGLVDVYDGTIAFVGAAGNMYNDFNLSGTGTLDISGIADASAIVRDLGGYFGQGFVNLGGKLLIIDQANDFFQPTGPAGATTIIATAGLQDGLHIKVEDSLFVPVNLSTSGLILQGWEDGFDTLTIEGNADDNNITGSRFADTIYGGRDGLGTGNDILDGGQGYDQLFGGIGDDTLTGGFGNDLLDGGSGNNTASYEFAFGASGVGVTVSLLLQGIAQDTRWVGYDTLVSIANITGSANGDRLTGDASDNILRGLGRNDTIEGIGGADILEAGTGTDTMSYANSNAGVIVNITSNAASGGHATADVISEFENITGSGFNDSLTGTSYVNVILGGAGNDNINASSGNDTINGGANNDTLRGGNGIDIVTGGTGLDIFYFASAAEGGDRITDFSHADDKFRFSGTAFGGLPAGALAANRFDANLSGLANTLDQRFIYETDTGVLRYDADGSDVGLAIVIANVLGAPLVDLSDITII